MKNDKYNYYNSLSRSIHHIYNLGNYLCNFSCDSFAQYSKQPYDNNKHNNKPDNIYQVIFTIIKKFYFPVKCSLMYCFQLFLLNIIVIIIEYIMHEYFIVVNDQLWFNKSLWQVMHVFQINIVHSRTSYIITILVD